MEKIKILFFAPYDITILLDENFFINKLKPQIHSSSWIRVLSNELSKNPEIDLYIATCNKDIKKQYDLKKIT